jgi:hypothetical protein
MAVCLCRLWAASPRETKKQRSSIEKQRARDKNPSPFIHRVSFAKAVGSCGEALQSSVRYQTLQIRVGTKTHPNDCSILGSE